jgi:hypothetical protein
VAIDAVAKSIAVTRAGEANWKGSLAFAQPAADRMTLAGDMNGKKIEMRLELFPREQFLLVTRGFNWVQEYPFNR